MVYEEILSVVGAISCAVSDSLVVLALRPEQTRYRSCRTLAVHPIQIFQAMQHSLLLLSVLSGERCSIILV